MDVAKMISALYSKLEEIEHEIRCLETIRGGRTQPRGASLTPNRDGVDKPGEVSSVN
jgi:hypothetical protein